MLDTKLKLKILGFLMKPLARFCMRHALSLQDFWAVAKSAFVTTALEEIKSAGEKVNTSRISAMTGLVRKDVKRLLDDPTVVEYQPSVAARTISLWENDPRFSSRPGYPRELSCGFIESEFNKLVYAVSQQLNAGTVLFELERSGLVKRESGREYDTLKLAKRVVRFRNDPEKGFEVVAKDMETLLFAAEENLEQNKPITNLHLHTEYDNIYARDLPVIRRWLLDEGKLFHKRARDFLSQFDKDVTPHPASDTAGVKVSLGSVSYTSQFPDVIEEIPTRGTPNE